MRQTIFAIAVALIAVIFAIQNSDEQQLNLFFWKVTMPLSLLIVLTLIIGIVAGVLIMTRPYLKAKNKNSVSDVNKIK